MRLRTEDDKVCFDTSDSDDYEDEDDLVVNNNVFGDASKRSVLNTFALFGTCKKWIICIYKK